MSNIENIVMGRVHRIHTLRRFLNPVALKAYGAGALLAFLMMHVSVPHVYANMPSLMTPGHCMHYIFNALLGTEFVVQLLFATFVLVMVFMGRDLVRNIKRHGHYLSFLHS